MQLENPSFDIQFHRWKTDFLVEYIINIHHAYLGETLPLIESDLQDLLDRYPNKYPLLKNLATVCSAIQALMMNEFRHQEKSLFPYIKQIYSAYSKQESYGRLLVRTLRKPMDILNEDDRQLNEHFSMLRQLTHNYDTSGNCNDYNDLMKRMQEFDNQAMLHKHIENDILFPAAIIIEQELLKP